MPVPLKPVLVVEVSADHITGRPPAPFFARAGFLPTQAQRGTT